jgi:hypothetical protein
MYQMEEIYDGNNVKMTVDSFLLKEFISSRDNPMEPIQ